MVTHKRYIFVIEMNEMIRKYNRKTLLKEERLSTQKRIDSLFQSGSSFIAYPLRVVFQVREEQSVHPISIMVSVPKRKFKRAVKRNRVKRLVKEAYRLNKTEILQNKSLKTQSLDIAFLYLKDQLPEYKEIEKAMIKTFFILNEKIEITDKYEEVDQ